jgi:serine/threonine protein kinase
MEKIILKKFGNGYCFKVSIGYFEMEISVLITSYNSFSFQRSFFSAGASGEIYQQNSEKNNIAIKSQRKKEGIEFDSSLNLILKEYFALKIASTLGYGPKLFKIFGFDLVCFENAIEFSMEFCQLPEANKLEKLESDLFTGLKAMHSLQIVHQDIKTENVSWSSEFKRWVFLDFGFASFIK